MKRTMLILGLLIVVGLGGAFAEEYDRDAVVGVMRANGGLMREIGGAIEAGDYMKIAKGFFQIAEGMMSIKAFDAPNGTQEDWDKTMDAFINSALVGVGACGVKYDAGIQQAYGRLRELNREGHTNHK